MRAIRERLDVSQAQVAQAMAHRGFPWHQTVVSKVERGERCLRLDEAEALAQVLSVEVADLLPTKKLTDAECAAEYWRASNMCWRADALGLEDPAGTDLEYESYTWLAFATHPHADEVEQTW